MWIKRRTKRTSEGSRWKKEKGKKKHDRGQDHLSCIIKTDTDQILYVGHRLPCDVDKYSVINDSSSNKTCLDCPSDMNLETMGNDSLSDFMTCVVV